MLLVRCPLFPVFKGNESIPPAKLRSRYARVSIALTMRGRRDFPIGEILIALAFTETAFHDVFESDPVVLWHPNLHEWVHDGTVLVIQVIPRLYVEFGSLGKGSGIRSVIIVLARELSLHKDMDRPSELVTRDSVTVVSVHAFEALHNLCPVSLALLQSFLLSLLSRGP